MKLTKATLKRIIKEELNTMSEAGHDFTSHRREAGMRGSGEGQLDDLDLIKETADEILEMLNEPLEFIDMISNMRDMTDPESGELNFPESEINRFIRIFEDATEELRELGRRIEDAFGDEMYTKK